MGQQIWVGTTDGLHELGDDRRVHVAGREVKTLVDSDSGWWAIVDQGEVWRSRKGGDWSQVALVENLKANCVLPGEVGPFIGTSEARLFALRGEALEAVDSFDEVEGREEWHTPWGGPPDVRSMSADPSGTVYVNVHVGGVVRSTDRGGSWEPTIDINSDIHQVLFDPGSGLVLAASARGLADSADGGESWIFDTDGLHGSYTRAVAVANGTVLVSASTGPSTDRAAVYRRPLEGGEPFERCEQGLPEWFPNNIDTFCLAASGSSVAFGTSEGRVFLSLDAGQSWAEAADDLPPVRCLAVA